MGMGNCTNCPNREGEMCLYNGLPIEAINECDFGDAREPDANLYVRIAQEIGELVSKKQAAYGNSFGKSGAVLELLYPNGVRPEQYPDMLTIVRIIDKLFRIATDKDAFGEDPWRDIVGYGVLSAAKKTGGGR